MLTKSSWREYKTDHGRIYYYNVDTKESRWIKPKELEDIEKSIMQQHATTNESPNR